MSSTYSVTDAQTQLPRLIRQAEKVSRSAFAVAMKPSRISSHLRYADFDVSRTDMKVKRPAAAPRRYTQGARAQATEATARRIVGAFLALLMKQWLDEITLDRVAEDAGVTVQTVVRRFGSKNGLLAESVKSLATQINARRASPPGDIGRLVGNLIEDYEQTGDAVIRLLALEPRHPGLSDVINFGRSEHRQWVSGVFAEPLGKLDARARKRALDALVITTDVYIWKLLRRDMARSVAATTTTMNMLVRATIAELLNSDG